MNDFVKEAPRIPRALRRAPREALASLPGSLHEQFGADEVGARWSSLAAVTRLVLLDRLDARWRAPDVARAFQQEAARRDPVRQKLGIREGFEPHGRFARL